MGFGRPAVNVIILCVLVVIIIFIFIIDASRRCVTWNICRSSGWFITTMIVDTTVLKLNRITVDILQTGLPVHGAKYVRIFVFVLLDTMARKRREWVQFSQSIQWVIFDWVYWSETLPTQPLAVFTLPRPFRSKIFFNTSPFRPKKNKYGMLGKWIIINRSRKYKV